MLNGRFVRGDHAVLASVLGMVLCASSLRADIPGVELFEDPESGSLCNLVNGANAQFVVLSAVPEEGLPQQLALVTGEDVELADSFVDEDLNVFFFGEPFGAIRFVEDGDGFKTLWWIDGVGNVIGIDTLTFTPFVSTETPLNFVGVPCDACEFWDNPADCLPEVIEIITQPASGTVCVGDDVTFLVEAVGPVDGYQWYKNDVVLLGATGNALTLGNVDLNDTATYVVDVIDVNGDFISSDPATLVVQNCESPPPSGGGISLCGSGSISFATLTLTGLIALKPLTRRRRGSA